MFKLCTAFYEKGDENEIVEDIREHLEKKEFQNDPRAYIKQAFPGEDDDFASPRTNLLRYILCRLARLKVFINDEYRVREQEECGGKR